MANGFSYLHAYKDEDDRTAFQWSDGMGVVEVRAKDTDAQAEHLIYWYIDRIEKGSKQIKRIQVWDDKQVSFFVQTDEGEIVPDESETINPRPHVLYRDKKGVITYEDYGMIPFFRLDNNRKQLSDLAPVKALIDDYDVMASSLSNNLADFDTPVHVVKGFNGDNFDELQQNLKTKKIVGVDSEGGVEVHTVDIPYQARQAKLELDEKNIYRFGFGLNTSGLKDTSATTNIAIKAAYSLLELKCEKLKIKLMQFLRKILRVVLAEINEREGTDFQQKDVYFAFEPVIMSNAAENAQIAQTEAATQQMRIDTLLNLAAHLDNETLMQNICDVLEMDYNELKDKLPKPENDGLYEAQEALDSIELDGGDVIG
jgi:SPP1 family phage portal protein